MSKKKQIEQILFESEGRVDSVAVDKLLALFSVSKRYLDSIKNNSWNEGYNAAMKGTEHEM